MGLSKFQQLLDRLEQYAKHYNKILSPSIVESDMNTKATQAYLQRTDSPELVAHLAVWLAGPDSDFLKGRYLWANWDLEELMNAKDKITANPTLLHLTLDGWSNNFAALK